MAQGKNELDPLLVTAFVARLSGTSRARLPAVAGCTVSWLARLGIIDVEVTGAGGSASYLVRLASAKARPLASSRAKPPTCHPSRGTRL